MRGRSIIGVSWIKSRWIVVGLVLSALVLVIPIFVGYAQENGIEILTLFELGDGEGTPGSADILGGKLPLDENGQSQLSKLF